MGGWVVGRAQSWGKDGVPGGLVAAAEADSAANSGGREQACKRLEKDDRSSISFD